MNQETPAWHCMFAKKILKNILSMVSGVENTEFNSEIIVFINSDSLNPNFRQKTRKQLLCGQHLQKKMLTKTVFKFKLNTKHRNMNFHILSNAQLEQIKLRRGL